MTHLIWILWLLPQLASPNVTIPPEVRQHLQAGLQAEQQRNFGAALEEFKKVAEIAPDLPAGHVKVGQAFIEQGQYGPAIAPLKRALELDPELVPAHRLLGYALLAQGFPKEAIPHLERAQDEGAIGIAQMQTDQPSEAVTHLQAALARNPNDPDLLFYLSRASEMLSSQSTSKLIAAYPNSARSHQVAGQNYFVLREYARAEKEYLAAIALRPDLPDLHLELGQVYAEESQWSKAAEEFRAETERQPGSAEAAFRLGNALLQQGISNDAFAQLQRSNQMRPDMTETLYALGKAGLQVGNESVAEKSWLRVVALEKEGNFATQAHFSLAGLYRKQRKVELADKEMQAYRKLKREEEAQKSPTP
jgi:tetratricopeptide (TPR) repeat protein